MPPSINTVLSALEAWFRVVSSNVTRGHLAIGVSVALGYYIAHRLWIWPYLLSPLRAVPGPPLGHLIFGQSPVIIRSESGIPQREWVKQYGPVIRIVGPIGIERLVFMKPEALYHILVKQWLAYPRPSFLRHILGLVTGYGLLTVTGNEHRQMRKAINPAFSIPNLMAQTDMYYDSIDRQVVFIIFLLCFNEKLPKDGKVFRMYDWMSKVTLDIICQTAFGYTADSLHNPHNELAEAYEHLLDLQSGTNLAKLALIMAIPGAPKFVGSKWAYEHRHWFTKIQFFNEFSTLVDSMYRIKRVSASILREKMEDSAVTVSDTEAKRDIMSLLVRARKADMENDKNVYAMSDRAMMDQVLTFLGAGHETTATGLSWTLWLLANDQVAQKRLRQELAPVFASNSRPDYRNLKDLQWLDCVIMESLRLLPPVPLTVRTTTQDDYVDGILVPKGTLLTIPIRIVNTWKVLWGEDAEEFNPSRWLNLPKDYNPVFSMLSFLAGPHACIGKTMAIIEMKAVLAALVANFEFEPSFVGQTIKPAAAITMNFRQGLISNALRSGMWGPCGTPCRSHGAIAVMRDDNLNLGIPLKLYFVPSLIMTALPGDERRLKNEKHIVDAANSVDEKSSNRDSESLKNRKYVDGPEDRRLIRKVDLHLLPILTGLYLLSFLDRSNVGNAKLDGLATDLELSGADYNTALALYFVAYVVFEVPSNPQTL
ncbi:hypothetical protein H0H92_006547 [Tricholoma furcatifolium]|nr:hypothetical protein H0H92_006547 [Tricholoma furcatifolium]